MKIKPPTPKQAADSAGSVSALAKVFDPPVTRQAVQGWLHREEIPGDRLWELLRLRPQWFKFTKGG